ncbi:MAG TPA: hypothetical protein VNQ81_14345 [Povalibacter sp.]|nr:hypothetical protein [Povalibacter sp.]
MKSNHRFHSSLALSLFAALGLYGASTRTATAQSCSPQQFCSEVATFAASITDFRTSAAGSSRLATATVRIRNKTDRPLVLGYVQGSGVVIDELGNRYAIDTRDANNVRAIGIITRTTFDPKFTLQPGESSDARFQFSWYAGNKVIGTVFQLEATLREIDPAAGTQLKLGREHVVQFHALTDGALAAKAETPEPAATAAALAAPAPESTAATVVPVVDACASQPRCYNAGPFTAQVTQVTTSQSGSSHLVRLNIRFHNISTQPLILGYTQSSGTMIDNYGNRYTIDWRYPNHVTGIGLVTSGKADPQFVLNPGESRNAAFEYSRYVGKTAIGTAFNPDLAVEQLQVLPSQQVRSIREYSINYPNLSAGTLVGDGSNALESINNVSEAGRQLTEGLKSLFKKKN